MIAINDSFNVSSLTDNGVGDYTVNYTTTLTNANNAVLASGGDGSASNRGTSVIATGSSLSRILTFSTSADAPVDFDDVSMCAFVN